MFKTANPNNKLKTMAFVITLRIVQFQYLKQMGFDTCFPKSISFFFQISNGDQCFSTVIE